jgi:hypothetical protein
MYKMYLQNVHEFTVETHKADADIFLSAIH